MPFVSIFSLIVVIAGAGFGAKSSPHSPVSFVATAVVLWF